MMSRKDFELLARALSAARARTRRAASHMMPGPQADLVRYGLTTGHAYAVEAVMDVLAEANPRFDRTRFRDAVERIYEED